MINNLRHFRIIPTVDYNQNLNILINSLNFMLVTTMVGLGAHGKNLAVQQLLGNLPINRSLL